jgi:hypothetical protein
MENRPTTAKELTLKDFWTSLPISISSICSKDRAGVILAGKNNPLKTMPEQDAKRLIGAQLIIVASLYCGANLKDVQNEITLKEGVHFILKKFGVLGAAEIKEAFELAACGELGDINLTAYFGIVSLDMIAKVLNAYKQYRAKILSEIERLLEKEERERVRAEQATAKNQETAQIVCEQITKAIAMAKEGISLWESWEHIPSHYAKIAAQYDLLPIEPEVKAEIWANAKELAVKEVVTMASDANNYLAAKSAKALLQKIQQGENDQDLTAKATNIYSKLLVWYLVNPK